MTCGKSRSFLTLIILKRSVRDKAKCGQMLLFSSRPAFFISALKMLVICQSINSTPSQHTHDPILMLLTKGMQPPHPVPAFVFTLRSPIVEQSLLLTHCVIRPLDTFCESKWVSVKLRVQTYHYSHDNCKLERRRRDHPRRHRLPSWTRRWIVTAQPLALSRLFPCQKNLEFYIRYYNTFFLTIATSFT